VRKCLCHLESGKSSTYIQYYLMAFCGNGKHIIYIYMIIYAILYIIIYIIIFYPTSWFPDAARASEEHGHIWTDHQLSYIGGPTMTLVHATPGQVAAWW
jgi:hypothetical protein